jgi:hypothetical protein
MRKRTNLFKKICVVILITVIFLTKINCSNAQELSNGTIDFIFRPENNWTQFVIWLENGEGEYIGTVYITDFIGREGGGNRNSSPDIDLSNGNRLSALPIWAHKRNVIDITFGLDNLYPPASTQSSYPADIDAVSGATPGAGIQTKTLEISDLPHGEYNCWIEVNRSYDKNAYHDYSSYRGQPSLVWNATIEVGDTPDSNMVLDYTGYGAPDGSDGDIHPPDSTITTAEDLIVDMGGYKFKVVYTPDLEGVDDSDSLSSVYALILGQNYPNPFNSSTRILYTLPSSAFVVLKIYDVLGNEIRTLVEKFQTVGKHTVAFDASGLSSGVYFYELNVNGILSETKKMSFFH